MRAMTTAAMKRSKDTPEPGDAIELEDQGHPQTGGDHERVGADHDQPLDVARKLDQRLRNRRHSGVHQPRHMHNSLMLQACRSARECTLIALARHVNLSAEVSVISLAATTASHSSPP